MTEYFDKEEVNKTKKKRKKLLTVFFCVLAAYLATVIIFIIEAYNLPYGKSFALYKLVEYTITALFVIFTFIFLGIPFRRLNRYYKLLINLETGIREENTAVFLDYDDTLHDKDGVDCKALTFLEWNKYKKDYFERKVLVFYEKDFPDIPVSAEVKFITQGNFLIEYEIIDSGSDGVNEKTNEKRHIAAQGEI